MDTRTAVVNRIFELCAQKELSIDQLASLSDISISTLKNILYGKSKNPGIVVIMAICDGLGITLNEFFSTPEFDALEQEMK